jgi:hypothetical protein
VVVKGSSTATGIDGLRGKNVLVSSRTLENAGIAWLDVLLGKDGLGRASTFFGSMKATDKAQGCILPVFFGTVDACVVDEVNLDLAKEMNPQVGQLKVLVRSRPMIENVVATPVEPHPYLKEWKEAMRHRAGTEARIRAGVGIESTWRRGVDPECCRRRGRARRLLGGGRPGDAGAGGRSAD